MSSAFASALRAISRSSSASSAPCASARVFALGEKLAGGFERPWFSLAPASARRLHASAIARAADVTSSGGASTSSEPVVSPLRRAPTPASAARGAAIPGALTDEGVSERARAVLRGTKGSPKKFGAFLRVIRGLRVDDALIQCDLSPKRVAKTVGKVIQSAVGNAVNNQGLDRERLVIDTATVSKGQYLRRVSMHGRGRAGVMHRPRSHVAIALVESDDVERKVQIYDDEMPWQRRRRLGRAKQAIAEAAGIA